MDIHAFERRIEKYEIVTFDIFDTLLKRDVLRPTDVFEIVQRVCKNRNQEDIDFRHIRTEAEKTARKNSKYDEVTLDEIYERIDIPAKEKYKSLEMETESEVLHREGYTGYKDIILSSDYRKMKRSGELYSVFLEKYKIKSNKVIHVGDSWYADYIGAKRVGINAIHIRRMVNNTLYMEIPCGNGDIGERSLFAFINNRASGISKRSELLGYEALGPILYGYCLWIYEHYEQIKEITNGATSLWFAARDMFLFHEAYKDLYDNGPKPDYIYISRKSSRPVLTKTTRDITESGNAFPRGECSVGQIVKRMGYNLDDIDNTENIDAEKMVNPRRLSEYPKIKNALSSPRILKREGELGALGLRYLKNHGFEDSKIVLADVGWHGTTQYVLQRILDAIDSKEKVYGLYLGCLDSTNSRIGKENYNTYAFNENEDSSFAKGILVFESLIMALHESTVQYRVENHEIVPVFGEPDNPTDFLISVQAGAMKFIRDYKNNILSSNVSLNSKTCTKAFCNLIMKPLKEELDTIGQMDYDDFELGKIAAPDPFIMYLVHPKKLYHDLKYCPWRIGFMYRLFKLRLPYGKIYSFIRGGIEQKNLITEGKQSKKNKNIVRSLSPERNIKFDVLLGDGR